MMVTRPIAAIVVMLLTACATAPSRPTPEEIARMSPAEFRAYLKTVPPEPSREERQAEALAQEKRAEQRRVEQLCRDNERLCLSHCSTSPFDECPGRCHEGFLMCLR